MKKPKTIIGHFLQLIGVRQLLEPKQTLKEKIRAIMLVLQRVKIGLDNPYLAHVIDFIPGDWADDAVEKLRVIFTSVLLRLKVVQNNEFSTIGTQTVQALSRLSKEDRNKKYAEIATQMVLLAGYIRSEQAAKIIVENEYQELKAEGFNQESFA